MLIKLYDYRAKICNSKEFVLAVNTIKKTFNNSKGMSTKTFLRPRPIRFLENEQKLGSIYINCTKRNIFCTLTDTLSKKVKSSCSLRVPNYKNEFNERENLYTRGLVLGKFFGSKVVSLGYKKILLYFTGSNKGRSGVLRSLSKTGIKIYSTVLITQKAHNGCRPAKNRRKKFRTKVKGI
jgi:small subunit ribosomal protein S11|uniref:Ribosomal protein S11 n=1 Tax=Fucus vesiculosus TaxID=49266 RepID=Q2TUJ5_FUCVE|nr:ribosomal protein S11 [Fucus vesiculosus]AAR29312.1 ribosomal protein S11 [Fucus vesiculosus]